MNAELTVESLLMDESFIDYSINEQSVHRHRWDRLRESDPEINRTIDEAQSWLLALHPSLTPSEILEEINKVKRSISPVEMPAPSPVADLVPMHKKRLFSWRVAAALLALLSLPTAYFLLQKPDRPASIAYNTVFAQTGIGERKEVKLPDGSRVILKSDSKIYLDQQYNQSNRHIRLEGDAYFDVFHDKTRPLTVHSGSFHTEALGTSFLIEGRDSVDGYQVQLLEGRIRVGADQQTQVLAQSGAALRWSQTQQEFVQQPFDSRELQEWINGELRFDQQSASHVFAQLEKWYGVTILDQRVHKGSVMITGNYSHLPLTDILQAVCFSLGCTYQINSQQIVVQ